MGSGKSAVGAALAPRLGLPFIDLDQRIQEREGRSIPELFSAGEARFRAAEAAALEAVLAGPAAVLACGGGAPIAPGALEAMDRWGTTIYLEVPLSVLRRRIARCGGGRPLWDKHVERRLRERLPRYRQARLHVGGDRPIPELVAAITRALEEP